MQDDLFGDAAPERKRTETWIVVDHLCSNCMGRLLKRRISPTVTEVRCAKCDARAIGSELELCWCGVNVGRHGKIFECIKNPNKRPEVPNAVLVREKPIVIAPPERRIVKSARSSEEILSIVHAGDF